MEYIQKRNSIQEIKHLLPCKSPLIVIGSFKQKEYQDFFITKYPKATIHVFDGECSMSMIEDIVNTYKNVAFDMVIGFGGGKIIDVSKLLSHFMRIPLTIIPSSASNDGVCSRISVLYKEDGSLDQYVYMDTEPEYVVVDPQIIFDAPLRLLIAGIGDALATKFESEALDRIQGIDTTALEISKKCYENLKKDAQEAINKQKEGIYSEAFEQVVYTNIYCSWYGFYYGGLSIAHAFHNAVSHVTSLGMHGEVVGLGLLFQLKMEKHPLYEEVRIFMEMVGLPIACSLTKIQKESILTYLHKEEAFITFDVKVSDEILLSYMDELSQ